MPIPVFTSQSSPLADLGSLRIDPELVTNWLVAFLRDECLRQRGIGKAIIGLSGGVDSAVVAYLCARAFGAENTFVFRMPYRVSSQASLDHAQLCIDDLGLPAETIDISAMVEGYIAGQKEICGARIGNVCSRCRMIILFDQSARLGGLPIGTGNKTERMFGYYTWHGDDAPPVNPLGDLLKTQVWDLARYLGVPKEIVDKPPTADLVQGQTDEGDLGIDYPTADLILSALLRGYPVERLPELGFSESDVQLVARKVSSTHWKRKLPTVAMLSDSAINEYYLRPVDYRGG